MITTTQAAAITGSNDLVFLEQLVEHGQQAYLAAGLALRRIVDAKLYKDGYGTLDAYCRERWGWDRTYAYRLIEASVVADNLAGCAHGPPSNEAQARELARAGDPDRQMEIWATVNEQSKDGKVTAKDIRGFIEGAETGKPKSVQGRRTPQWLFDALNELFGPFRIDAHATAENALCEKFFTEEDDGNAQPWESTTFGNPEFKSMQPAVEKAVFEQNAGIDSCILGPAVGSQTWFHETAIHGTIWMPDCRINFDDQDGNPTGADCEEPGADRDTVVMTYGYEHRNREAADGRFLVRRLEIGHLRP